MDKENKELSEIESFRNIREYRFKIPLMGHLSINILIRKIIDLSEIVKYLEVDFCIISQTAINEIFPSQQFVINILRLGLGKIGTIMEVVLWNLSERVLFVRVK